MKKYLIIAQLLFAFGLEAQTVQSPSKELALEFKLVEKGRPCYTLNYKNKPVILKSLLGVYLKGDSSSVAHFNVDSTKISTFNETWKPVLGEQSSIVNHHNK